MLMRRWVQQEVPLGSPSKNTFSRAVLLGEATKKLAVNLDPLSLERLSSTIAINTRLSVITQAMGSVTAGEIQQIMPENAKNEAGKVAWFIREKVLPDAMEKRISAYNVAYKKLAKWSSIAAAQLTKVAMMFAVGDVITKIHGQGNNFFDLGVKLLIGAAITLLIARKLIKEVTKYVSIKHRDHTFDIIEQDLMHAKGLSQATRTKILKVANSTWPQIGIADSLRELFGYEWKLIIKLAYGIDYEENIK